MSSWWQFGKKKGPPRIPLFSGYASGDSPVRDLSDEQNNKVNERFDILFEIHRKSNDPAIMFLINQLYIARLIFGSLITKVVLTESDHEIVKVFFNTLKSLYKLFIKDESLREELTNYNTYLSYLYSGKFLYVIREQKKYNEKAKQRLVHPKRLNAAGNEEKTDIAYKALDDMLTGLNKLIPRVAPEDQILRRSRHALAEALNTFAKKSKALDATSAALATGMAAALNGSSGSSGASGTGLGASIRPNQLAKLEANLAELEAGLPANNGVGAVHAELNKINSKLNKYAGLNNLGLEPTNEEDEAYLQGLMRNHAHELAGQMPKPPTNAPKGGKRKSKTRSRRTHGRKTRKMRR